MIQGSKKYLSPYINEQNLYFKSWPNKSHGYKISTSFIHTLMYSLSLSLSQTQTECNASILLYGSFIEKTAPPNLNYQGYDGIALQIVLEISLG